MAITDCKVAPERVHRQALAPSPGLRRLAIATTHDGSIRVAEHAGREPIAAGADFTGQGANVAPPPSALPAAAR
jgi:hypothetical protein